jgi:hypothetical protein
MSNSGLKEGKVQERVGGTGTALSEVRAEAGGVILHRVAVCPPQELSTKMEKIATKPDAFLCIIIHKSVAYMICVFFI